MVVGCYDMHLYCDNTACERKESTGQFQYHWPEQVTGKSERSCIWEAVSRGWKFKNNATIAICPDCVRKKYK